MQKAKHAFGSLERIDSALAAGTIDAYDILFVKDENGKPYVGWIDKDGNKIIIDTADLEAEIQKKANSEDVEAQIDTAVLSVIDITNAYTDTKVAEAVGGAIEVIEF